MKLPIRSLIATVLVAASQVPTLSAQPVNSGAVVTVPDTGPTAILLALGLIGLAVAAKKRFKRD